MRQAQLAQRLRRPARVPVEGVFFFGHRGGWMSWDEVLKCFERDW